MQNNSLFTRCRTNTNIESDVFVGIRRKDDFYEVCFPLGFHRCEDEKGLRKDILSLINILAKHSKNKESELYVGNTQDCVSGIPVQAYLYIIKDYFERGYYKEKNSFWKTENRGKIDWGRTIKSQKPLLQYDEPYFLKFKVKKKTIKEDEIITLVHKYCVYESFDKFGWLFTSFVPQKPVASIPKKTMLAIVSNVLQNTYNDRDKQLFRSMISVINSKKNEKETEFQYGTYRFEYIWEKMIDRVFGVTNKELFFPKTTWNLLNAGHHNNAVLEPDTVMLHDGKVYVLDAKYYKYGWSGNPRHLPESTSINKQITYGEYIAESDIFMKNGVHPVVYNAFIMPYDSTSGYFSTGIPIYYIGNASSDWKVGKKEYENVLGILMDVKYLIAADSRLDHSEIIRLAEIIENSCPV